MQLGDLTKQISTSSSDKTSVHSGLSFSRMKTRRLKVCTLIALILVICVITSCTSNDGSEQISNNTAVEALANDKHEDAVSALNANEDTREAEIPSVAEPERSAYETALLLMGEGNYEQAIIVFSELGEHEDAQAKIEVCTYKQALLVYNNMDFESALALLMTLPDGYEDTKLYIDSISAIDDLVSENWLEAAEKFGLLHIQKDEFAYNHNSLMNPLAQEVRDRFGIQYELQTTQFYGLQDVCILLYYEEQMRLQNDITQLSEYPYDPSKFAFQSTLCDRRIQKLKASIDEQGLREYYNNSNNSVSPVNVTGNGLYTYFNSPQNMHHIAKTYMEHQKIAPWCLADSPEDVRYVLTVIDTYSYFGTYDNGTKGYSTSTQLTLRDTFTGEYLFYQAYRSDPPRTTARTDKDTYGSISLSDIIMEEILPILAAKGLTVYS